MKRSRWNLLVYKLPREPSRHRVAVWRKLKDLGALYLQDGVVALPEDAVTREQLEWLQLRVREAGGEATLWGAEANTAAEERALVERFRRSREAAFEAIVEAADLLRARSSFGADQEESREELRRLEREFRAERRRDYFRSPKRAEAAAALRSAREALRGDGRLAGTGS